MHSGWTELCVKPDDFYLSVYLSIICFCLIYLIYLSISICCLPVTHLYSSINHLFFASVSHLLFTYYLTRAVIYILSIFIVLSRKPYRLPQNNEQSISAPTRKFASRICSEFVRESVGSLATRCKCGSRVKQYLDFFLEKDSV